MRPTSLALAFSLCLSLAAFTGCGGSVSGGELLGSGGSGATGSGGSGTAGNGGSGTAGSGGSAGASSGGSAGGGGHACGPTTCPHGQYCCNSDCGICAPIGSMCPAIGCGPADAGPPPPIPCGNTTCPAGDTCCTMCDGSGLCVAGPGCPGMACPDCTPQDASGSGTCNLMFGYRWDGQSCVPVGGCSCQGADCSRLFTDYQSCLQAYSSCTQYYN